MIAWSNALLILGLLSKYYATFYSALITQSLIILISQGGSYETQYNLRHMSGIFVSLHFRSNWLLKVSPELPLPLPAPNPCFPNIHSIQSPENISPQRHCILYMYKQNSGGKSKLEYNPAGSIAWQFKMISNIKYKKI